MEGLEVGEKRKASGRRPPEKVQLRRLPANGGRHRSTAHIIHRALTTIVLEMFIGTCKELLLTHMQSSETEDCA